MPKISEEIKNVDHTFLRPVVYAIVEDLKASTRIPMNTKFFFMNPGNGVLQRDSGIGGTDGLEMSETDIAVSVEIEEEMTSETKLTTIVYRPEVPLIFKDLNINVYLKPAYTQVNYTLTFKARFEDKASAVAWRNAFRRLLSVGSGITSHTVEYSYEIPNNELIILKHIYNLRQKKAPYNDTFKEWMLACFDNRITSISNLSGEQFLLVMPETQANIYGYWDIDSVPDVPEESKETNTWQISIPYKFSMHKPFSVVMQYPNMVHNTLLNKKFRYDDTPYRITKEDMKFGVISGNNWEMAKPHYGINATIGLCYPNWDDWKPKLTYPATYGLMSILLQVDSNDRNNVIDITDLGDYALDPELLEILKEEAIYIGVYGESFFKVTLYEEQLYDDTESLFINNNLVIRTPRPMDLRKVYHLTLSLLYDLLALSEAARLRLRKRGLFFIRLARLFYPGLDAEGLTPKLLSNGWVSTSDFIKIANIIRDYYKVDNRPQSGVNRFVGQFIINGLVNEGGVNAAT